MEKDLTIMILEEVTRMREDLGEVKAFSKATDRQVTEVKQALTKTATKEGIEALGVRIEAVESRLKCVEDKPANTALGALKTIGISILSGIGGAIVAGLSGIFSK